MIDINLLRKQPEKFRKGLELKISDSKLVDKFLGVDKSWREKVTEFDALRKEKN